MNEPNEPNVSDKMNPFARAWPAGHFYSPLPSMEDVQRREKQIFDVPRAIPGVELNEEQQLATLIELSRYYAAQPFSDQKTDALRYYFDNPNFRHGEAIVLYCMIRHLKPQRIVEIGSGYSSSVILDTNDLFFNGSIACTFVEPEPALLFSLFRDVDKPRVEVLAKRVQDVDVEMFARLSDRDILFVDSSHVCKIGSDVNHIVFQILPHLQKGVFVHFHDIYYPFEYPREWIHQGRAWNEAYLVRAFLQYNDMFSIQFFNSFLGYFHRDQLSATMPFCAQHPGSSLWMKRMRPR